MAAAGFADWGSSRVATISPSVVTSDCARRFMRAATGGVDFEQRGHRPPGLPYGATSASICLSVNKVTNKVVDRFSQNLVGRCGMCQARIAGTDADPDTGSVFHFPTLRALTVYDGSPTK